MILIDKSEYKGNWKNDKFDGFGILKWENQDYYEGNWKNGKKHGEGLFKC